MTLDQQYIDRLKQGVAGWNRWRTGPDEPAVICLRQADLRRANLAGVNFSRCDLHGARLDKAQLQNADLRNADLGNSNLSRSILRSADLRGAHLKGEYIGMAELRKAKLQGADLSTANLRGTRLQRANLQDCRLIRSDFLGANLSAANLHGAILSETILADALLSCSKGLAHCQHRGPSVLDYRTLQRSVGLPVDFLRGCGLSETLIGPLPVLLNPACQYYSCFISYSHEDKTFARRLYHALQEQGIRCWLDEHQMLPGDDIYEQVDRGIRLWDKVLLCCSRHSLTSWWVDNEIDSAFEKERKLMNQRTSKTLALIPLDLDGYLHSDAWSSGKKRQVRSRLAEDFAGWEQNPQKFSAALKRVTEALRADELVRESPPVSRL
jgi:hypothetical protein